MKINKKVIGAVGAGMFALSVLGVGAGMGVGTVSADDPADHKHPHVTAEPTEVTEPVADSVVMEERFKQAFIDAGFNPVVECKAFSGSLGASADGLLMAESTSRILGHDWDPKDMKDSAASISVEAGAEAIVCAGAGVRHSISGTGFSNK